MIGVILVSLYRHVHKKRLSPSFAWKLPSSASPALGQLPSSEVLIQHRWLARQRETEKAKADTQFWFCLVCSVVGMLLAFHQRGWRPLLGSGLRDKPAAGWGAELNLRCAAAADRRCLVRRAPALCRASCLFELLASSYKFDCMHAATTTRKFWHMFFSFSLSRRSSSKHPREDETAIGSRRPRAACSSQ